MWVCQKIETLGFFFFFGCWWLGDAVRSSVGGVVAMGVMWWAVHLRWMLCIWVVGYFGLGVWATEK